MNFPHSFLIFENIPNFSITFIPIRNWIFMNAFHLRMYILCIYCKFSTLCDLDFPSNNFMITEYVSKFDKKRTFFRWKIIIFYTKEEFKIQSKLIQLSTAQVWKKVNKFNHSYLESILLILQWFKWKFFISPWPIDFHWQLMGYYFIQNSAYCFSSIFTYFILLH